MATRDIALDPATGRLNIAGGLRTIEGVECISQRVGMVLRTRRGELPFDITKGLDYFGIILVKAPDLPRVQAEITSQVLAVRGVQSIRNYSQTLTAGRSLTVTFTAVTEEGEVQAEALADPESAAEAARLGGVDALVRELQAQGAPGLAALIQRDGISAIAPSLVNDPRYASLSTLRDHEQWLPLLLLLYPIGRV